ncbi:MAG: NadS family protein [Candidatus Thiodiazotropha endolucinida]|nr:helix-turn-helix domain-containing protein [Candidatus Thiodiazotropha taylori]MCG8093859.1 helix-turn-helix domain-containing protein [Candidatus Thiodiazotropha endolucinida]MCG7886708.1 helix-turn-helix domain-containing protein [Candidatus Thiodiazotropha taylori]MCG7892740.1 helix-turn-helix domain-containing protein [Candidatus Thiodiazotropha taylori]MCG7953486.1 helix-turn-helix domain-containing protein [Candidatus Thiodiazotropha taylori]
MKKEMFDELLESVQEMDEIVKGKKKASRRFEYPDPEVKAIRDRLGVSQEKFALLIGVSKRTVENWEQGRRHPTGAARSLLRIVEADPEHALRTLST